MTGAVFLLAAGLVDALVFGQANPAMRLTRHEGVQVVETAALSENWVCRGSGSSYNLFNWKAKGLRPNADYTLVVRARSFAGGNAFNALVMLRRADGKIIEGFYPAKGVVLGAGTEVDPPRNPYGKRAQGLNVLAIGTDARPRPMPRRARRCTAETVREVRRWRTVWTGGLPAEQQGMGRCSIRATRQ